MGVSKYLTSKDLLQRWRWRMCDVRADMICVPLCRNIFFNVLYAGCVWFFVGLSYAARICGLSRQSCQWMTCMTTEKCLREYHNYTSHAMYCAFLCWFVPNCPMSILFFLSYFIYVIVSCVLQIVVYIAFIILLAFAPTMNYESK